MASVYFPHDEIRDVQKDMMQKVKEAVEQKRHLIVHAPTGLGKTAAALAPAVSYALREDKTVLFLTSRHTQHQIAVETLKQMKEKFGLDLTVSDIIGKKGMCLQPNVEKLYSGEFAEYCKSLRTDGLCDFYSKTRKQMNGALTVDASVQIEKARKLLLHVEEMNSSCKSCELCPYEIAVEVARKATVIVTDYYYVFHPTISENFFEKIGKKMEDVILIIDEGHNLAGRLRDLNTDKISSVVIRNAIKEAKEFGGEELLPSLVKLQDVLNNYASSSQGQEKVVGKDTFVADVKLFADYQKFIDDCEYYGTMIRENQKKSYIGSVGNFLNLWQGDDDGYVRIFDMVDSKFGPILNLNYKCLDPSLSSESVLNEVHSAIMMSGTLTPTEMYKDLLGFPERVDEKEYETPFAKEHKLSLVVGGVSSKYSQRNDAQYRKIASMLAGVVNTVPGNSAVFFPSYAFRDQVSNYFNNLSERTVFMERPGMTKEDKEDMLKEYRQYKEIGAVLLGVAGGSFGEGIDLPGDYLKCVVVVGLPLGRPDLETKHLIEYYNEKYGKGWDYGYILPAITKVFQNAGRCIRSETDKGVVIYMDERYGWPSYARCFPEDEVEVSEDLVGDIKTFFGLQSP